MSKYVVSEEHTIREVMQSLEENHERVALVENKENKIIGVFSKGDIIRALVSGMSLYVKIKNVIRPSFFFLKELDYEKAYKIFKSKRITLLPIIDDEAKLVSVVTLEDIFHYLEKKRDA